MRSVVVCPKALVHRRTAKSFSRLEVSVFSRRKANGEISSLDSVVLTIKAVAIHLSGFAHCISHLRVLIPPDYVVGEKRRFDFHSPISGTLSNSVFSGERRLIKPTNRGIGDLVGVNVFPSAQVDGERVSIVGDVRAVLRVEILSGQLIRNRLASNAVGEQF